MGLGRFRKPDGGFRKLLSVSLVCSISVLLFVVYAIKAGKLSSPSFASLRQKILNASQRQPIWAGFENVDQFFVFGDSFSDTRFNVNKTQPSIGNPLGNPKYPHDRIHGPNWVQFMTETYNKSFVRTYSLARGASTVDQDVIENFFREDGLSFKEQVNNIFIPNYAPGNSTRRFHSNTTLFGVFFGVNEIELNYFDRRYTPVAPIFQSYLMTLERLYDVGARNFLLLTVPPIDIPKKEDDDVHILSFDIHEFNKRIMKMRARFAETHSDATIWVFDLYTCFSTLIATPKLLPQTAHLRETHVPCGVYDWGLVPPKGREFDYGQKHEACLFKMNEYFWLNDFHPTYPVYNATAASIVEDCFTYGTRRRWCL